MYDISRILNIFDNSIQCATSRAKTFALYNQSEIISAINMLDDDDSKNIYVKEIMYCLLVHCIHPGLASNISGLDSLGPIYNNSMIRARKEEIYNYIFVQDDQYAKATKDRCIGATFILEQYKYKNLVCIEKGDICIDAGACLGDTAIWFILQGASQVHSFEIDKSNLACFKNTVNHCNCSDKIFIHEYGLGSEKKQFYYLPDSQNIGGGRIFDKSVDSSYPVNVTTIDDFCSENNIHPNFIKMDIEGAEPLAIEGAKNTLINDRPKFAICIYHTIDQRLQIPLLLKSYLKDYKFYIKKVHPTAETVLFGKPI